MLFGEGAGLGSFYVDYADDFVLGDERHGEFRANAGCRVDEVLFRGDVVDQYSFAALHGLASHALSDLDADAVGNFGGMPDLEAHAQLLGFFVEQENGENFVIDDLL